MNWFQRHLNWTWVIVVLVGSFVIGLVFGLVVGLENPYALYTSYGALYWLSYLLSLLLWIIISVWVLRRKNRSLWWLLVFLVPFIGWIIFLCLENRSDFAELRDTENRVVGPPPRRAAPPPKMMGPSPKRGGARDRTDWD